jgi:hypothetical protein
VGDHYAYVGREVGLDLDAQQLERAFHPAWQQMPRRPAIDGPRETMTKAGGASWSVTYSISLRLR